ncbi:MAG: lamin tail domain-containing protein [Bacteroidota bacterium]
MRTRILSCLWAVCLLILSFAQLSDDFSDGDLLSPDWQGQIDLFSVTNEELQLTDVDYIGNPTAIYLDAPTSLGEATTWSFLVRLDFSPSSSNFARMYLSSNSADLSGPLQGYYLQIGGISGSDDALVLYRQDGDGGDRELILSGITGGVGTDPAIARVEVTRSTSGEWSLSADYSGGDDLQLQGVATDNTFDIGQFFGIWCQYTTTRSEDFYFDDITIDPLYVDTDAPVLLSGEILSATEILLTFNETLDPGSAQTVSNYTIDQGIGSPITATWSGSAPNTVVISLGNPLVSEQSYTITTENISDVALNAAGVQSIVLDFVDFGEPAAYDVLINEIMAAPPSGSSNVLLPSVEYVELYNRSSQPLNLEDWQFSDGGTPRFLTDYTLLPGEYVVLLDEADLDSFPDTENLLGVESFPGLNNTGDNLQLFGPDGMVIHRVPYNVDWYANTDKDDGGWSLELINPDSPCEGQSNWRASDDLLGGTPGRDNSVLNPAPDTNGPGIAFAFPNATGTEVWVTFSEGLEALSAENTSNYVISSGIQVVSAFFDPAFPDQVRLALTPSLDPTLIYTLQVKTTLTDCLGNGVGMEDSFQFGIPSAPDVGDILINEILFFPEVGGKDFVELYNASSKVINLNDLIIGNIFVEDDTIIEVTRDWLILPGDYLVLTELPSDVKANYEVANPQWLLQLDALPSFPSDQGNVTIYTRGASGEALILDAFNYSEDLHNPLLDEDRGVSLERVDLGAPTDETSNWQSAAATIGFGTPTAPNSQVFSSELGEDLVQIAKKTFTPNGDGIDDFLIIDFSLLEVQYSANIRIYDALGREVKNLVQGELLGTFARYEWEGDTKDGSRARIGPYIVWVELFTAAGDRKVFKLPCVLGGAF